MWRELPLAPLACHRQWRSSGLAGVLISRVHCLFPRTMRTQDRLEAPSPYVTASTGNMEMIEIYRYQFDTVLSCRPKAKIKDDIRCEFDCLLPDKNPVTATWIRTCRIFRVFVFFLYGFGCSLGDQKRLKTWRIGCTP